MSKAIEDRVASLWNITTPQHISNMEEEPETPLWSNVLDYIQLTVAIIGILANVATIITLGVKGRDFSDVIRMLFRHQSVLDCLICLTAALLFGLPVMWTSGNHVVDVAVCQLWHGQYLYWTFVWMSIHNLVTIAAERYLCICHPVRYQTIGKRVFRNAMIFLAFFDVIVNLPSALQTNFRDGQCHSELLWKTAAVERFFAAFTVVVFLIVYAIPTSMFFILYGMVIAKLRKRMGSTLSNNNGVSGTPSVIIRANTELTKTAIVVAVIFILALGVDCIYYLLAHVGAVEYVFNSPIQKISVFCSVTNSVVNPFVYASFMPLYRKSVQKMFLGPCSKV